MHRKVFALALLVSLVLQIACLSTAQLDMNHVSNSNAITAIKVLIGMNIITTAIALQLLDIRRIMVHEYNDSHADMFHIIRITLASIALGALSSLLWWKYDVNNAASSSSAFLANNVSWAGLTLVVLVFKYSHLAL